MSYEAALCVQRLQTLGQKQGFLTYAQINDHLPPSMVDPAEISELAKRLEASGIRVLETPPVDRE